MNSERDLYNFLCKQLRSYDISYRMGEPSVSDEDYDALYRQLEKLEHSYPELINPYSPTQIVESAKGNTYHLSPMLSIENCWNEASFDLYLNRIKKTLKSEILPEIVCEPKYDGVALSLTYYHGVLVQALTRGDGIKGEMVLDNILFVPDIPHRLEIAQELLVVRGELIIHERDFQSLKAKYANARNLSAGIIRNLNPNHSYLALMKFYAYGIEEGGFETHYENLEKLIMLGFRIWNNILKTNSSEEMLKYYNAHRMTKDLPFLSDGVVFKVNSKALQKQMGNTLKHPRAYIAYKTNSQDTASVILRKIFYQVGRTGKITPVAAFDQTALAGVIINRASLFNTDYLRVNNIKVGTILNITRSGGVIPYIQKAIDPNPSCRAEVINNCPCCDSLIKFTEKDSYCLNLSCHERLTAQISFYASKDIFDIHGLNTHTISTLLKNGKIKDFFDLFQLKAEDLKDLPLFGNKKIHKLLSKIKESAQVSIERAILSLEIPGCSKSAAKALAQRIQNLQDLMKLQEKDLDSVDGLGIKKRSQILSWLQQEDSKKRILRTSAYLSKHF